MQRRPGFTLVELVVVVLVMGILAAVGVGKYQDMTAEGEKATLQSNVETIQLQIDLMTARRNGQPPVNIRPEWFQAKTIPPHPQDKWGLNPVQRVNDAAKENPNKVVLTDSAAGAYWYNVANGSFRARVMWQGSRRATLDYYNEVNDAAYTNLDAAEAEL
ncbi:MAG: prepilin-type N-terminal cleavage/methylation domain-containing protein [Planctomycetota bacterium]